MSSDESDDDFINLLASNVNDNAKPDIDNTTQLSTPDKDNTTQLSTPDKDNTTRLSTPDKDNTTQQSTPDKDNTTQQSKSYKLKELDHNFLDDPSHVEDEAPTITAKVKNDKKSSIDNYANSSDDEDAKYFEKQNYSEYGKDIKNLLKNKESEKANKNFFSNFKKENAPLNNVNINTSSSLLTSFNSTVKNNDKYSLQAPSRPNTSKQNDVYRDPIFGLRIINPLISSAELTERMSDKTAVPISMVKTHITIQSNSDLKTNWVVAGVLLNKSATLTSQNGHPYCIWKVSDLSTDMKTVSLFLFSGSHKNFWKLSIGTAIAILNPTVLERRDDKDLAALSIDNAQKIIVLGTSKDLGKCKSQKRNGEPCTAPVNLSVCEYCVFHIKQEYGKYSKRSEFQSTSAGKPFGNAKNPFKQTGLAQQRHPQAQPFIAIPAKRNETLYKKDCERLALLRGDSSSISKTQLQSKTTPKDKVKRTSVELTSQQVKKDLDRLSKLRQWGASSNGSLSSVKEDQKPDFKLSLSSPKLGNGMKNGIIDLSEPIKKSNIDKARLQAIEYAKKIGGFKKTNPNKIRADKEVASEKGVKRRREAVEDETVAQEQPLKKVNLVKNRFQEMLEMKSAHSELILKREDEQTEEYFKKLEVKERMEEKMLNTYKVDCKAVRCVVCKYIAFSSSDLCKKLQHPLKVIDAVKRFFKCGDCGYRTVSLDRIPTETCKRCASSKWIKTAMMDEKRTEIAKSKLCIRGGEEKYIGSTATDASLDLIVPE